MARLGVIGLATSALDAGLGERDFTDIVELIGRQVGVTLRIGPPRTA